MKVAIVDNDSVYVNLLSNITKENFPTFAIYCFSSVNELIVHTEEVDILLLDIEMPNQCGMDFAKRNYTKYPNIIYVSSHNECMVKAFDVNVAGFIIKNDELEQRLVNKIKLIEQRMTSEQLLTIRTVDGVEHLKSNNILYFHSEEDCIYMHTFMKSIRLTVSSLAKLENDLNKHFIFINRNVIINLNMITTFYKKTQEVTLNNDIKLKVSERRWKNLLETYNRVVNVE